VKDRKTSIEPPLDAFSFAPPAGAEKLSPDALLHLDECATGVLDFLC
jgi:hypothetical protein